MSQPSAEELPPSRSPVERVGVTHRRKRTNLFKFNESVTERVSCFPVSDDLTATQDKRTMKVSVSQPSSKNLNTNSQKNHLFMDPKREKMISRSSSVVTGFNLQTKRTFSGGLTSASGRSPTYSRHQTDEGKPSHNIVGLYPAVV